MTAHALMRLGRSVGVVLALGALVPGCGDDDDGGGQASGASSSSTTSGRPDSRSGVTYTFDGQEYTCEEALDVNPEQGCGDEIVAVWERWGENLPDYVSSGQLGPLNDESISGQDVAYAGVMACVISNGDGDEQDFIDFMQDPKQRTGLEELSGTELLPAWFEARVSLCPVASGGDGYVIP